MRGPIIYYSLSFPQLMIILIIMINNEAKEEVEELGIKVGAILSARQQIKIRFSDVVLLQN